MLHTSIGLLMLAMTLIGFTANANPYSAEHLNCLAQNIYHESRGEISKGQLAVAFVTLNRVSSEQFPDSVCSVVYQRGQFTWSNKKKKIREQEAWERSKEMASIAIALYEAGEDNTKGALYFDGGSKLQPYHKHKTVKIGKHSFYQ